VVKVIAVLAVEDRVVLNSAVVFYCFLLLVNKILKNVKVLNIIIDFKVCFLRVTLCHFKFAL